jgi:hypothetical protein
LEKPSRLSAGTWLTIAGSTVEVIELALDVIDVFNSCVAAQPITNINASKPDK